MAPKSSSKSKKVAKKNSKAKSKPLQLQLKHAFELDSDHRTSSGGQYRDIVVDMRAKLAEEKIQVFKLNIPVLPREIVNQPTWCTLKLEADNRAVIFLFLIENMYMVAYRRGGEEYESEWFEFREPDSKRTIEGSYLIPCGSSYLEMIRFSGVTGDQLKFGKQPLHKAVTFLYDNLPSDKTSDKKEIVAKLMFVITTVAESVRFNVITELIVDKLDGDYERSLPNGYSQLFTSWSQISHLLVTEKKPQVLYDTKTGSEFLGKISLEKLASNMGMLKEERPELNASTSKSS